ESHARRFVAEGARVVLSDRDGAGLADLAAEVGDAVEVVEGDASNEEDVTALVATAVERFGRLDVAFANAGIGSAQRIVDADLAARVRVCIAEGEAFAADLEVETASGRRWHSLAIKATRDPLDGSPAALIDEADITLRKSLTARLEQATATFASIVENHADGLLVIDEAGPCFANVAGEAMLAGRPGLATELGAERAPAGTVRDVVLGPGRIGELRVLPTIWEGRSARLATIRDISELRRAEAARAALEERMQQTQRLDSLGRLAGGVAHDFNNLLLIILGSCELAALGLEQGEPITPLLAEINAAAERAAGLTRRLLAFSRKQFLQPQHLDLDNLVREMSKLLVRVLGEDVGLVLEIDQQPCWIRADPTQIEQIIMNLAVNA
ncbi:MAG: SDR family oxidoreductase, partial [Myxococcales bacterium]|nr:SDR family oxidoreductase [Myxococcales bacterium]